MKKSLPRSVPATRFAAPRPRTVLLLALAASLLLGAPAPGQNDPNEAFGEVIDVRVVNLEVVVTRGDERVRGLGPDDFVLEVDGREIPIEYFTEVSDGTAVRRPSEASAEDATLPALTPGESVGTSYLVFIDDYFTRQQDRDHVLEGLVEQISRLGPNDQMAVVGYDGQSLEMLSNWSDRPDELRRALRKAELRDTYGLKRLARNRAFESNDDLETELGLAYEPRPDEFEDSYGAFIAGYEGELDLAEEQYARLTYAEVRRAVEAAAASLRSFAGPPGRKVMLLLSGGWPSDPALWTSNDSLRAPRLERLARGVGLFSPLIETANLLGYTVYPVDVPGLSTPASDVETVTADLDQNRFDLAVLREREEEAALFQIARETGGKALVNTNRSRAFEATVEDTRSYYWLGFTPDWQGDDSAHSVRVDVRAPGAEVRARRSFSDLSRSTEVTMMVESALRLGDPPSDAPLGVKVGLGERAGIGKRSVPLEIAVPVGALTFLPSAEGVTAKAELRVAVLDEEGGTTEEIPVVPMTLTAPRAPAPNEVSVYRTSIKLRNERHDLVVSLYDVASGKILASKVEIPER